MMGVEVAAVRIGMTGSVFGLWLRIPPGQKRTSFSPNPAQIVGRLRFPLQKRILLVALRGNGE